jgi:putative ABC transport system ATP-binding protein
MTMIAARPPAAASLIASGVTRSFTNGSITTKVLGGVDLIVQSGEMTLIVGPSGSGKSTLLAVLSGLLRPDGGAVQALGCDLWRQPPEAIDRFRLEHCGFVFQGFNLFPALTAAEQVVLPLQYTGLANAAARARADEALAAVGLHDKAALYPLALSGGEKQRVAVARAIAKRPQLLFADEPTSALDKENGANVARLLHAIARSQGATVLCVSHDPRLIAHADRVVRIEDGVLTSDERNNAVTNPDPIVVPELN